MERAYVRQGPARVNHCTTLESNSRGSPEKLRNCEVEGKRAKEKNCRGSKRRKVG